MIDAPLFNRWQKMTGRKDGYQPEPGKIPGLPQNICLVIFVGLMISAIAAQTGCFRDSDVRPQKSSSKILVLENGIEVLLLPNSTSRLVTAISVIKTGSAFENPELSGVSHYLEHLLFNGTHRRSQKEIYAAEDFYGGFNNAFTRKTHTAFMITMPAKNAEFAFDLQSDMGFNSSLPEPKFAKERGIILEELAKDQTGETFQMDRLFANDLYPESAYGLPVLGTAESLKEMKLDNVRKYYEKYYTPENVTLVVLGGFDEELVRDQLSVTYGRIPSRSDLLSSPPPVEPIQESKRFHHELDISQSVIKMVWNAPAPNDESFLAATIAADLLFNGDASPLAIRLQELFPGSILSCGGYLESGYGFSRLIIQVSVKADQAVAQVVEAIPGLLTQIEPPTASRIQGWKTASYADEIFSRQRSYMYAPLCSETIASGGVSALQGHLTLIDKVTDEQIATEAEQLTLGPYWTLIGESTAEGNETGGEMNPAMSGVMPGGMPKGMGGAMPGGMSKGMGGAMPGGTPKSVQASESGRESDDRSGNIAEPMAQEERDHSGADAAASAPYSIHRYIDPNGIKLVSISVPTDGSLSIYMLIDGRNYLEPEGKEGITELLHNLLTAGTTELDEVAIEEKLSAVGGQIQCGDRSFIPFDDYYTSRDFSFIRLQALDQHADRAFELLTQIVRYPRFPETAIEREKNRLITRLEREAKTKKHDGYGEMRALLFPAGHPEARSPYGSVRSLKSITREDLISYHKLLMDGSRIWVGVVSGLSTSEQEAKISALLPSSDSIASVPNAGFTEERLIQWNQRADLGNLVESHLTAALEQSEYQKGKMNGVQSRSLVTGKEGRGHVIEIMMLPASIRTSNASSWSAMTVAGKILSSRLSFELREERGLAYGIGASIQKIGDRGLYIAAAGTREENLREMAEGFVGIRTQPEEFLTVRDVQEVANKQYGRILRRQEMRLNQAMFSVWAARDGREPGAWWLDGERLQQVSPESVNEALALLRTTKPAVVIIAE